VLAFVANQRDQAPDQALLEPLALFSFVTEDFKAKATKKQEHIEQLATMVILTQDVLRELIAGERESSPVTLAALARIALEVHVNLRFITKGPDPAKYADRYRRCAEIEKLTYQRGRPKELRCFLLQWRQTSEPTAPNGSSPTDNSRHSGRPRRTSES
jgi:hypothetical protein